MLDLLANEAAVNRSIGGPGVKLGSRINEVIANANETEAVIDRLRMRLETLEARVKELEEEVIE